MANYERRLQRLEEIAASADERPYITLEMCQKRTAELLASKEVQAWMRENPEPEISAEDWAAKWEAWQAEHAENLAKARQFFASFASGHSKT